MKQLLLFFLVFVSLQSIAQLDTFSIRGRVVDAKTGKGMPFANVVYLVVASHNYGVGTNYEGLLYSKAWQINRID